MTHIKQGQGQEAADDEVLLEAIDLPVEDIDQLADAFRNRLGKLFPGRYHDTEAMFRELTQYGITNTRADDPTLWTNFMPQYVRLFDHFSNTRLLHAVLEEAGFRIVNEPNSNAVQAVIRTDKDGNRFAHVYDHRISLKPRVLTMEQYEKEFPAGKKAA